MGAWIETMYQLHWSNYHIVASYMGAWIETIQAVAFAKNWLVASYMGAWIETSSKKFCSDITQSHPTWVRGLKHECLGITLLGTLSHPTWVRGLKPNMVLVISTCSTVASYMGAWIETLNPVSVFILILVASYMGAWIETQCQP